MTTDAVTPIHGLHIIANFAVDDVGLLTNSADVKCFLDEIILKHGLCKVGEVYHDFPGGAFTAVICLTESHLSLHTWPENHYCTFDVFLSNFLKDNSEVTHLLYEEVRAYFGAKVLFEQIVNR